MNRAQLLKRIRDICYNDDQDIISLDSWDSLTVPQLRTVVSLIDDGGAEMISARSSTSRTRSQKGSCFMLKSLVEWIQVNPTNPRTRRSITPRQREIIEDAYRRMGGPDVTAERHIPIVDVEDLRRRVERARGEGEDLRRRIERARSIILESVADLRQQSV